MTDARSHLEVLIFDALYPWNEELSEKWATADTTRQVREVITTLRDNPEAVIDWLVRCGVLFDHDDVLDDDPDSVTYGEFVTLYSTKRRTD